MQVHWSLNQQEDSMAYLLFIIVEFDWDKIKLQSPKYLKRTSTLGIRI